MRSLELLAPAKDLNTAVAAIDCGADAVYIGAEHHGARVSAANSAEDIKKVCEYAHQYRARVYVTLNTLVYDDEIDSVRRLIDDLYKADVDALIVQDMALLEMDIPPIELHASTQCDIRSVAKARFLEQSGFSQLVLPRELTLEEIREIRNNTTVPLEAFVHGAICVCYSGDCRASFVNGGRSGNRGECAQLCRLAYDVYDVAGKQLEVKKHVLSMRDMNRLDNLSELIDAGITSFKIEGRLKSEEYVRNVTAAYSKALNDIVSAHPGEMKRSSVGRCQYGFEADVNKTFNRGYTSYFLQTPYPAAKSLASMRTPKFVGEKVGKVISVKGLKEIEIDTEAKIVNGDGLVYFDKRGKFSGFRVNRNEGKKLLLSGELETPCTTGTILYRNFDKHFFDGLKKAKSVRRIGTEVVLASFDKGVAITLTDERGCQITEVEHIELQKAKTEQKEGRRKILEKIGDTIYYIKTITDTVPNDIFIPASVLTSLRRRAYQRLDGAGRATFPLRLRTPATPNTLYPKPELDMHDNVSNELAKIFYEKHGSTVKEKAIEIMNDTANRGERIHVMTTRYCLRREMGLCPRTNKKTKDNKPFKLVHNQGQIRPMEAVFDCKNCQMLIYAIKESQAD